MISQKKSSMIFEERGRLQKKNNSGRSQKGGRYGFDMAVPFLMKENKICVRGELALIPMIFVNSFAVVLMLYSGSGISAISSVPYAFNQVLPGISLGTWTYIFQGLLVAALFVMKGRIHIPYLFSFVVGFFFGLAVDLHEAWIGFLPKGIGFQVLYFCLSYLLICFGIALANRCKMPIVPTDLFPREFSQITGIVYSKVKICFDVSCLAVTVFMTWTFLGHLKGLGVGTVLAAFTMGKVIGWIGDWMDRHVEFVSCMEKEEIKRKRPQNYAV